jgi:DnaJ-class molecular chaperone
MARLPCEDAVCEALTKYHPDTTQTDEPPERFLEIKEAYNTLSDETKRRDYDRELEREGCMFSKGVGQKGRETKRWFCLPYTLTQSLTQDSNHNFVCVAST